MDVELALGVVKHIEDLDVVMVISGDSDLLPLKKYVLEKGKKIIYAGFKQNIAWELRKYSKHLYLDDYKKEQMQTLDKGIEDVLGAYTTSIENRIQNPGFVLNVELSEKGKGELRAKWQELSALQKIEIDKEKLN